MTAITSIPEDPGGINNIRSTNRNRATSSWFDTVEEKAAASESCIAMTTATEVGPKTGCCM